MEPETDDFVAWLWNESAEESDDGNSHTGYGISQSMDDLSPEDATGLIEGFPPTSDNYSSEDIVDVRFVHWVKKDADGTVLSDWYHVQHFDQNTTFLAKLVMMLKQ